MYSLLAATFVASLLGSVHCLGMCGPFALMAGARSSPCTSSNARHFAGVMFGYHIGRLVTYLLVGTVAGGLGMAADVGGQWAGWQRAATLLAGITMVLVAVVSLARHFGWLKSSTAAPASLVIILQKLMRGSQSLGPRSRSMAIGFLTTWMPCGWLYVFALAAAGTAHPVCGAALMAAFWLGTIPALAAVVLGSGWITSRLRWNPKPILAGIVLVMGLLIIFGRAQVSLENMALASPRGVSGALQQVHRAHDIELPCCCEK